MVNKATRISEIWKLFHDRLVSQVTSVEITGNTIVTIQRVDASYNDSDFSTKSNLPIIIVETPTFDDTNLTMNKEKTSGYVVVETYTTQSESADKFSDSILDAIETYKTILSDNGLKNVHGKITDSDFAEHGKIKIHVRRMKFSFDFFYTKTRAY